MNEFWVLVKKDSLEIVRSKKLMILLVLFLFVSISSPIMAKLLPQILKSVETPGFNITVPEPTYLDSVAQFVKNISQLAMLVVLFLVAGAVVDEKNRKNLEILLTKPVSRTSFILSKYFSLLATVGVVYIAASVIFYAYTSSLFTGLSLANFWIVSFLILIYMILAMSVTIFASTMARHPLAAAGIGFAFYAGVSLVSALVKRFAKFFPDYILVKYPDILKNGWDGAILPSLSISLFLIFLMIALSVWFFKRQEIEK